VETLQESLPDNNATVEPIVAAARGVPSRQSLPAKGTCWYCEKPLDAVRRFCGKSCADAFDEEAEYTR
jgi:hypothetical protein